MGNGWENIFKACLSPLLNYRHPMELKRGTIIINENEKYL
jgi:hypothetical protein